MTPRARKLKYDSKPEPLPLEKRKVQINNATSISIGLGVACLLAVAGLAKDKGRTDERVDQLETSVARNSLLLQAQDKSSADEREQVNARLAAIETKLNIVMIALGIDSGQPSTQPVKFRKVGR